MLMTGFGAGVPSKAPFPVMVPAVAASSFFASGAAAGDEGLEDLLLSDPHADIAASRAASAIAWYLRNITFYRYHSLGAGGLGLRQGAAVNAARHPGTPSPMPRP